MPQSVKRDWDLIGLLFSLLFWPMWLVTFSAIGVGWFFSVWVGVQRRVRSALKKRAVREKAVQ